MHIELDISANRCCDDIKLELYFNHTLLTTILATDKKQTIAYDVCDDSGNHVIKLIMTGKNNSHTVMNDAGEIVEDVFFSIDRLEFEEIDVKEIFCLGNQCYTHDFNSSQDLFLDEFYGILGCNGTVEFKFSTPMFLWLENYFS